MTAASTPSCRASDSCSSQSPSRRSVSRSGQSPQADALERLSSPKPLPIRSSRSRRKSSAQVIGARAGIAPPSPGTPGPFALGGPGHLASLFEAVGMSNVTSYTTPATVRLESVDEHLRFLKDAFGVLHMLMANMSDNEKSITWDAVADALAGYEGPDGFVCPGELTVCTGTVD